MGLVYAEGKYTTLTDILGAEDAFGDMDFKVAGTADAITALQLDTKIDGIPADVLAAALEQAKEARTAILANMNACIAAPRDEVAATAPKIISITIPMDKIGEVIGPKGKVINTIQQETGADIAVDDDGSVGIVTIGAVEAFRMEEAKARIHGDRRAADGRGRRHLHGQGREHHQVRCVRQHPPGSRRSGAHLEAGPRQADQLGRGRAQLGQEIEVVVEEIDEKGKVSLTPTAAWSGAEGGSSRWRRPRPWRRPWRPRPWPGRDVVSFDDAFDAELAGELGDLGPGWRGRSATMRRRAWQRRRSWPRRSWWQRGGGDVATAAATAAAVVTADPPFVDQTMNR
jgi:polyribonucleotide nucleotidyltransferase